MAEGQNIERRASFGIRIGQSLPEQSPPGVPVEAVLQKSTAAAIGVQPGDVILNANGQRLEQVQDLFAVRQNLRAGEKLKLIIWRNGKEIKRSGKAKGVPYETSPSSTVLYEEVAYKEGWLRLIANKPLKEGKHPTIFFIPGYTCAGVDNLSAIHPYRKLIDSLVNLGYGFIRVEKPGMGDNVNTGDCFQLGFDNEMAAYETAYKTLGKYDWIDQDNIFIVGHSMGGIYAPILASKVPAKGLIVYGTTHITWVEYLLQMLRFQNPLLGEDPIGTDQDMHLLYQMLYEHYYQGKSSKELYKNPDYKTILRTGFRV